MRPLCMAGPAGADDYGWRRLPRVGEVAAEGFESRTGSRRRVCDGALRSLVIVRRVAGRSEPPRPRPSVLQPRGHLGRTGRDDDRAGLRADLSRRLAGERGRDSDQQHGCRAPRRGGRCRVQRTPVALAIAWPRHVPRGRSGSCAGSYALLPSQQRRLIRAQPDARSITIRRHEDTVAARDLRPAWRQRPSAAAAPAHLPLLFTQLRRGSASLSVRDADVEFMAGMIPHHAQAVIMAGWAPSHGAREDVAILCERIVVGQRDEIATMQTWLRRSRSARSSRRDVDAPPR